MKKFILSVALAIAGTAMAQTPDEAAMQKAWQEYMTPSQIHNQLAQDDGTWTGEMTMWMDPKAEPIKNKMTATNRMILGGRYQESRHTGDFMGMPFEGVATTGYDNASGKMVSTWVDNMGTGIMYMEGDYDGKSKSVVMRGKYTDPMTKKVKEMREVYTLVDENTRKMEMYDKSPDGKEYKSMEMVMTRQK